MKRLWLDEGGAILSAELCLIMVLLVIGMVVGLTALRDAVDLQLCDIAGAIAAINPEYEWVGLSYVSSNLGGTANGASAWVSGAKYNTVELPKKSQSMLFTAGTGSKAP
jgi:hypothetical protein